jgi:cytoskeleton protein RodZ
MEEPIDPQPQATPPRHAGALLAEERAKAKLTLADVAARTRIPERHLAAIEEGAYGKLPSRTYAVGFSRTYARLLGLDERAITDQVRLDLESGDPEAPLRPDRFEPGDPARIPSRRLAWLSVLAVILLVAGGFAFYRTYFSPAIGPAPLTVPTATPAPRTAAGAASPGQAPAAIPTGPVVFTSLADGTWVRFYDGAGKRLFEGQMARGQSYTIPADAVEPKVWTGRPQTFAITVGGRPVPKLSEREVVMKDVPVSAEALLARTAAAPSTAVPAPPRATPVPLPPPAQ